MAVAKKVPLKRFLLLAIPIIFQSLLSSSRTIVDTFMINSLGETAVAAMGAAGKPLFVMLILLLAISNGEGVIASQQWGKKDLTGVRKSIFYAVAYSFLLLIPFLIGTLFFSPYILRILTKESRVITLATPYLQIASLSFVPLALTLPLYTGLSAMNQLKESSFAVLLGVAVNIVLNYLLIYGIGIFPQLGLTGAAIGTLISACAALLLLLTLLSVQRRALLRKRASLFHKEMLFEFSQFSRFVTPFVFNGLIWVSGIFIYFSILGNMGVTALAVLTILAIPEMLCVALYNGLQTASGIIIGQQLGAGQKSEAESAAVHFIRITIFIGAIVALTLTFLQGKLLSLFDSLQGESLSIARSAFPLFILFIFCKAINSTIINGILRVGGDVRYIVLSDAGCHWLWGIPLAAVGHFVFHLPFVVVYAFVISEECLKIGLSFWRYGTKKWVRSVIDKGEKSVTFCHNTST